MRLLPTLCALLLGAGAALATGCGDRSGLLPQSAANDLKSQFADVREQAAAQDCGEVDAAIARARSAVDNVEGLDGRLKSRLLQGIGKLSGQASRDCRQTKPAQETTPADTTTTSDTTPSVPREPADTGTTPTEPPPTDTGTPSTPVDPTSTDPDGGVSPEDPGTAEPGPTDPETGGASPGDPGTGTDPGFGARDRDQSGPQGYYP